MSFAIIRGGNGRRHEVDFGDDPVRLDVSIGVTTVQITVEATDDPGPPGGRRFATLAVPREELIAALGTALGRAGSVCLDRFSGLIGGVSAGFRPPRSAAGE